MSASFTLIELLVVIAIPAALGTHTCAQISSVYPAANVNRGFTGTFWHQGLRNFLLADGHVQLYSASQAKTANGGNELFVVLLK